MSSTADTKDAQNEIKRRDNIRVMYVPIRNPSNAMPMLQLRKHGDCTLADPRVCFDNNRLEPQFCCVVFRNVSAALFHSLVLESLVNNGQLVVLFDWVDDLWMVYQAVNPIHDSESSKTVQNLLDEVGQDKVKCKSKADLLTENYEFVQYEDTKRRGSNELGKNTAMERNKWASYVKKQSQMYWCERTIYNMKAARELNSRCMGGALKDTKERAPEPILVIEGKWNLSSKKP